MKNNQTTELDNKENKDWPRQQKEPLLNKKGVQQLIKRREESMGPVKKFNMQK